MKETKTKEAKPKSANRDPSLISTLLYDETTDPLLLDPIDHAHIIEKNKKR